MSIHIDAKPGDIAETVLLPGDPLRAQHVAEHILEGASCYNKVRGMYGYTGRYRGRKVSVQGTGMGVPSISIYVNELITEYGAKNCIRIGTCGSLQPDIGLRDVILAMSASTDSNFNAGRFQDMTFSPTADFGLLQRAYQEALTVLSDGSVKVGSVMTTDTFYHDDTDHWRLWAAYRILAVEMETAVLYTLGAKYGVRTLSVLTVSDDLVRGEKVSSDERQRSFDDMVRIALNASDFS